MVFGYKLRTVRESAGMSQYELSKKSGVSRATIWAIENGQEKITTTKTLYKLARALNVSVADIFCAQDD